MKYLLTMLLFVSTTLMACKKTDESPDNKIPAKTQHGADILSCKVNGKWHHYSGKGTYLRADGVYWALMQFQNDLYVSIWADETVYDDFMELNVYTHDIENGKVYEFAGESKDYAKYSLAGREYVTGKADVQPGYVRFNRFDDKIAAGEFSFTAYRSDGSKMEITDGFFDIKKD